ncbi:MAG: hypothetical protein ACRELY_06070 [Polyangiaceae bacterium]
MSIEALLCPACGAPLALPTGATAAICHYCHSALRVSQADAQIVATASPSPPAEEVAPDASTSPVQVVVDPSISPETIARIKELVLLGKRDDAITLHETSAHCDRATSESAIEAYVAADVWDQVKKGRLNALGMAIFFGALSLVAGGIGLAVTDSVSWPVAVAMVAPGALVLLFTGATARRTFRYLFATTGEATVLRFALVGKSPQKFSLFRLLLDVRGPSASAFRVEILAVLKEEPAQAMAEGRRIQVKYFPGVAGSVLYDEELSQDPNRVAF